MIRPHRLPFRPISALLLCTATCLSMTTGCADDKKPPRQLAQKYEIIPVKKVPDFMLGTIWEKVDVGNTDPFQVSSYGLVVNLDYTGDSNVPIAVKEWMIKDMIKHGYGSKLRPGWENQPPERVLRDKRVAIVEVLGMLPAGIRKGQTFDAAVQCLASNQTSSLAGGELYLTDLKINGADPRDPTSKINEYAQAKGFVFVNPAYALNKDVKASAAVRASLRNGVVMDGCVAKYDRPLFLRLRVPETRVSRRIEQRIIERFQDTTVAQAEDEGIVQIFVPYSYRGNWQHFAKLVTHVYLDSSPELLANKAKMLVGEAQKPDAKLEDISFCWEAIGPAALPFLAPLLTDKRPDIAYAAARAAAFIGDPSGAANAALLGMARDSKHPFQLNAVETFGGLIPSAAVNEMLRGLLESDSTLVRIEAYKVLARNHDRAVMTRVVTNQPNNQKFVLDIVPSNGPPIVYATRTGMPRIAIIGPMPEIGIPVVFAAMNDRLTISSHEVGQDLTIFYRVPAVIDASGRPNEFQMPDPVKMESSPALSEVVQRLGGIAREDERPLNFTYSEVLAIIQQLHQKKLLVAAAEGHQIVPVSFILQDPPAMHDAIYNAPSLDIGRPQGEDRPKVSQTNDPAADTALLGRRLK